MFDMHVHHRAGIPNTFHDTFSRVQYVLCLCLRGNETGTKTILQVLQGRLLYLPGVFALAVYSTDVKLAWY